MDFAGAEHVLGGSSGRVPSINAYLMGVEAAEGESFLLSIVLLSSLHVIPSYLSLRL